MAPPSHTPNTTVSGAGPWKPLKRREAQKAATLHLMPANYGCLRIEIMARMSNLGNSGVRSDEIKTRNVGENSRSMDSTDHISCKRRIIASLVSFSFDRYPHILVVFVHGVFYPRSNIKNTLTAARTQLK
ncbi:hypothetical protein M405DRAFT_84073 [Rhizopogon salebrosus TDB-379]|nr:hypothetical protein M405DRAFT_84073 [Rhizopogon salebrosus TDB-379]